MKKMKICLFFCSVFVSYIQSSVLMQSTKSLLEWFSYQRLFFFSIPGFAGWLWPIYGKQKVWWHHNLCWSCIFWLWYKKKDVEQQILESSNSPLIIIFRWCSWTLSGQYITVPDLPNSSCLYNNRQELFAVWTVSDATVKFCPTWQEWRSIISSFFFQSWRYLIIFFCRNQGKNFLL